MKILKWVPIILLLSSCIGTRLSFKAPKSINTERAYEQKTTEINVPIEIDIEGFRNSLKRELPSPLASSSGHTEVNASYIILEMHEKMVEEVYSWVEKVPIVNILGKIVKDVVKTGTRFVKKIVPTEVEKIVAVGVRAEGAVFLDDVFISSVSNNQIKIRIDLSIKIDIDIDDKEIGIKTDLMSCSGGNRMKVRMNLMFSPTWTQDGNINLGGMIWKEDLVDGCTIIKIGDEHLSLEDLLKLPLIKDAVHKQIEKQVEKILPNQIELNEDINKFWNESLNTIKYDTISNPVFNDNKLFLKYSINPVQLNLERKIFVSDNLLNTAIGVEAKPRIDVINKIQTTNDSESKKLKIQVVDKVNNSSIISLGTSVSLKDLSDAVKIEILDSLFEVEDKKYVKVKSLSVYQSDSLLVFKLKLRKALRGDIYVFGQPYYNRQEDGIKLQNIKLSLKSKANPIPPLAVAFFNKDVKKVLDDFNMELKLIPLVQEINDSQIELNKETNSRLVLSNVKLDTVDILLSEGRMLIDATLNMNTKITGFKK